MNGCEYILELCTEKNSLVGYTGLAPVIMCCKYRLLTVLSKASNVNYLRIKVVTRDESSFWLIQKGVFFIFNSLFL